jgi:hypothetical protein
MSYIKDIAKSVGDETAVLKKVNEANVNKWGDADTNVVEKEITAVFELLSGEVEEVTEGDFETGDLRAFIPDDFDGVEEGNIIVYEEKDYKIQEVLLHKIGHESHYEVRASKT